MNNRAGFLSALFDFSFTSFVAEKLVKFLYGAIIALLALAALVHVAGQLDQGFGNALGSIIIAPVLFLLGVTVARINLEVVMVLFRIADHTAAIAHAVEGGSPSDGEEPHTTSGA